MAIDDEDNEAEEMRKAINDKEKMLQLNFEKYQKEKQDLYNKKQKLEQEEHKLIQMEEMYNKQISDIQQIKEQ